MRARTVDRIGLGLAGALAIVSAGWFGTEHGGAKARAGSWAITGEEYRGKDRGSRFGRGRPWVENERGPHDAGWRFELFSPPALFLDGKTGKIRAKGTESENRAITSAEPATADEAMASPVPRLESVEKPLFRLQLTGYVGKRGEEYGVFENGLTGETLLARAGQAVPALQLTIEKFDVERATIAGPDGAKFEVKRATAIVRDAQTGERLILRDSVRCRTGEWVARIVGLGAKPAEPMREVRTGDEVEIGEATYRVASIRIRPPAVELEGVAPAGKPRPRLTVGPGGMAQDGGKKPSI